MAALAPEEAQLCPDCAEKSEALFDREMSRIELIRTVRGIDVELYDIKHPDAVAEKGLAWGNAEKIPFPAERVREPGTKHATTRSGI